MFSFTCFIIGAAAGWACCYFWPQEKALIADAIKKAASDDAPKA